MTTIHKLLSLFLLALSFGCQSQKAPASEYALTHRITDNANILTAGQEDSLITIMENLEQEVGSQMAILTVPSLDGQTIEELSLKTANDTGLGRATHNNGVLITVAYQDRQTRIEVGTGLENILKDEIAAQIIREDLAPKFVEEKFGDGLYVAVQRIARLIKENEQRIGQGIE